jgi:hypothetical protein
MTKEEFIAIVDIVKESYIKDYLKMNKPVPKYLEKIIDIVRMHYDEYFIDKWITNQDKIMTTFENDTSDIIRSTEDLWYYIESYSKKI